MAELTSNKYADFSMFSCCLTFFNNLQYVADENVISFPISDITDDSHLSISKEENFIWRKGTNVKKLDDSKYADISRKYARIL